jgi:RNA polymerase sigma factor (sigma-70 family)
MAGVSSREVLRGLNTLFHCGAAGQRSDAELLESFVAGRDQAAEAAFAALVDRHGAMVLGVCRRVLGNQEAALDAFQATFLVLARKARAIARREQLASWLHGVARRAALDARAHAARHKAREQRVGVKLYTEPTDHTMLNELRTILDDELARLPERHRAPVVLCELEGLSRRDAAARLKISEGTLSSRLARAKARLRERLTKRGFALSAVTLTSILTQDASAVIIPPALADSTIRVATLVAAGSSLTGVTSTSVMTLTEGVLKAMLLAKLRYAILGAAALALVSTSVGVLAQHPDPNGPVSPDRLKVLEQKLDRLLEVLGGPRGRTTDPTADVTPRALAPAGIPNGATRTLTKSAAPATTAPASGLARGFGASTSSSSSSATTTLARGDVIGRVDRLERKLNELERRFSDLEQRITSSVPRSIPSEVMPPMPPIPPPAPLSETGVPPVPPTPPTVSGPSDDLIRSVDPFSIRRGAPDADSDPSTSAPEETIPAPSAESLPPPPAGSAGVPEAPAGVTGSTDPA